jgi:hypothetical protein
MNAQDNTTSVKPTKLETSLGVRLGLDYGGIGANILYYPVNQIGLFGGVGYALAGYGYNFGAKFRLNSKKELPKIDPYLIGMYGYNTAIVVKNASFFDKLFYGPTVGFGIDFNPKSVSKKGYWSLALLVPIRSSDVEQYIETLENNNNNIEFQNGLLPIGFSIGYRLKFK